MAKTEQVVSTKTGKPVKMGISWHKRERVWGWLFASPVDHRVLRLLRFSALFFHLLQFYELQHFATGRIRRVSKLSGHSCKIQCFRDAVYNPVYFTVFFVPLSIIFGVSLALFLNMRVKGMAVYRTISFFRH